ncbi:hypothetical protein A0U40_18330 [[Bacillus] sp. KCTC 13219]|nr:hypothetical protein A0U40_18330 [[Bacillus] sp. KCTC 13219]
MRDNRVFRNLPPVYDELLEMEKLSETVAVELDELDVAREKVEAEQFIMTASEKTIRTRERGYDIRADPSIETLDFRRRRLIVRQSTRLPITQRKVHEIINELVGSVNWEERLNVETCETLFIFDASEASVDKEIDYTLERILPLNIALKIARRITTKVYVPSSIISGSEVTLYPMNIEDINQQIASNNLAALKTAATITIMPM